MLYNYKLPFPIVPKYIYLVRVRAAAVWSRLDIDPRKSHLSKFGSELLARVSFASLPRLRPKSWFIETLRSLKSKKCSMVFSSSAAAWLGRTEWASGQPAVAPTLGIILPAGAGQEKAKQN